MSKIVNGWKRIFRRNIKMIIYLLLLGTIAFNLWYNYDIITSKKKISENYILSFGIITDIQYANKARNEDTDRYERDAINKVKQSVSHWKSYEKTKTALSFVVNLGDIIDGHDGKNAEERDILEVKQILKIFSTLKIPSYHIMGNHGVKNIGCKKLVSLLGMPDHFYDVIVAPGWRFLFLDGTDMSFMIDSYSKGEAEEYHKIHKDRLYGWNGGLGKEQRDWLQKMMREAKENGEKLILFCHWPLINLWTKEYEKSLLWNNDEILEMLDPEVVFMFLSGHMHSNGYIYQNGIHFLTFGGTITAPVGETAHGVLHLHQHGVLLEGFGELSSVSHFYSV